MRNGERDSEPIPILLEVPRAKFDASTETNTLSQVLFSAKLNTQTFHGIRVKGLRRSVETSTQSFRVGLFEWTYAQPLLKLFFDC